MREGNAVLLAVYSTEESWREEGRRGEKGNENVKVKAVQSVI